MKKIHLLAALSLWAVFTSSDCGNEPVYVCGDVVLKFEINLEVSPLRDTIRTGDTLWLSMSIPGYLTDMNSNEDIHVLGYDFKVKHGLNRMDVEGTPGAYHEFGFAEKLGKYERFNIGTGGEAASLATEQVGGGQKLRVGLIPQHPGLFQMDFYNHSEDLRCQPLPAFGEELNDLEIMDFKMNNGDLDENNYPMLLASPVADTQPELIASPEVFVLGGGYIFQVVE